MTRTLERAALIPLLLGLLLFAPIASSGEQGFRTEHDLLGDKEVPAEAYYGVQTARALENFQISGRAVRDYPELVRALAETGKRPCASVSWTMRKAARGRRARERPGWGGPRCRPARSSACG